MLKILSSESDFSPSSLHLDYCSCHLLGFRPLPLLPYILLSTVGQDDPSKSQSQNITSLFKICQELPITLRIERRSLSDCIRPSLQAPGSGSLSGLISNLSSPSSHLSGHSDLHTRHLCSPLQPFSLIFPSVFLRILPWLANLLYVGPSSNVTFSMRASLITFSKKVLLKHSLEPFSVSLFFTTVITT